jgi:hypothetical protein
LWIPLLNLPAERPRAGLAAGVDGVSPDEDGLLAEMGVERTSVPGGGMGVLKDRSIESVDGGLGEDVTKGLAAVLAVRESVLALLTLHRDHKVKQVSRVSVPHRYDVFSPSIPVRRSSLSGNPL